MFKKLTEKMGKDKGSILKAKYIDVKKISAQIEDDLKQKSNKEKLKKKSFNLRHESHDKTELDIKKHYSKFTEDTKAVGVINCQQDIERLHPQVSFYLIKTEAIEECHIITDKHLILKEYNNFYFREFHFIYVSTYFKHRLLLIQKKCWKSLVSIKILSLILQLNIRLIF